MDAGLPQSLAAVITTYSVDILQIAFVLTLVLLFSHNQHTPREGKQRGRGKAFVQPSQDGARSKVRARAPLQDDTVLVSAAVSSFVRAVKDGDWRGALSWFGRACDCLFSRAAVEGGNHAATKPAKSCSEVAPPVKVKAYAPRSELDQIIGMQLASLSRASRNGDLRQAEQCFDKLREVGHPERTETFNQLIAAAARKANTSAAELWFNRLRDSGCTPGVITYHTLMDCHAKFGDLLGAESWYQKMVADSIEPRRTSFQILINAAGKANNPAAADKWFQNMMTLGFAPDMITFTTLIDAKTRQGTKTGEYDLAKIDEYYTQMIASGIQPDVVVFTTLITAAAKAGDACVAERWFQEMEAKGVAANIAAFTAVVMAHARAGNMETAEERCFQVMRSPDIPVDEQFFAVILDGYSKACNVAKLEEWFGKMIDERITPTTISYAHLLACYARMEPYDVKRTIATVQRMAAEGVNPNGSRCLNLARQVLGDAAFRSLCSEVGYNPNHHRWSRNDRERARDREKLVRNGARRNWVEVYGNPNRSNEQTVPNA